MNGWNRFNLREKISLLAALLLNVVLLVVMVLYVRLEWELNTLLLAILVYMPCLGACTAGFLWNRLPRKMLYMMLGSTVFTVAVLTWLMLR